MSLAGRLAALGFGPRVLKTSIAAGLAWWLGTLLGQPLPVFACIAAIVGLQPTVANSLTRAGEQLAGMVAGLALASVMLHLSGSAPLTISLLILLATWIGSRLRLRQSVIVEFSITALLVVVYTDPTNPYYGLNRIWEGVLGGLVAVGVNALVLPPEYLGEIDQLHAQLTAAVLASVGQGVADLLDGAVAAVVGVQYERLEAEARRLAEERSTLDRARDAVRYSPLRRRNRATVERYSRAVETLQNLLGHARGILRIALQHARREATPRPLRGPGAPDALAALEGAVCRAIEQYAAYVASGDVDDFVQARQALTAAHAARQVFLRAAEQGLQQAGPLEPRVDLAAVVSELEHILTDLESALDAELEYVSVGEPRPDPLG